MRPKDIRNYCSRSHYPPLHYQKLLKLVNVYYFFTKLIRNDLTIIGFIPYKNAHSLIIKRLQATKSTNMN